MKLTMDWRVIILIFPILFREIESRPSLEGFLKSYVENERVPTMVVFNGICWKKSVQMKLMKDLSRAGIRSSSSVSTRSSYHDVAVLLLLDLDCLKIQELFDNATRQNLQLLHRWLVLTSSPIQEESPLWNHFLVNSDLVVAQLQGEGYKLTELHKPSLTGPVILTPRGMYAKVLTDVRPHRELFRRRQDLLGAPITMSNVIQDHNDSKFHLLQEDRLSLEHDVISKNSWILGKLAILMLNSTPRPVFSNRFGYVQNGKWTGLVKDLRDNSADIGTNIGMSIQRLSVVAFIDNLDNSRAGFVFRQPALSYTSNVYYLSFSSGVWIATIVSAIVAGVAFLLSMIWTGSNDATFGDAFLLSMSAVSQQGCELQPKNLSARIILFVIFTSLMALYAAYGANIVVLLQAPSNSIRNLQQLSKAKIALGALDVDYNHFLFKGSNDRVRKEIARRVDPDSGFKPFYNLTEGVKKLRKGRFAFHAVTQPIYRQIEKTFTESEKCDLVEIDFMGYRGFYVPANKQSPYLELLRVAFKRLRESGIKSAVNFRLEVRKPSCKDSVAMFSSVGVTELRAVLEFIVCGVALSVAVLFMEIVVFRLTQRQVSLRYKDRFMRQALRRNRN